jgi:hypothetical protein
MAESASDDRWLPIETAPQDGSAFLAYGRHEVDSLRIGGRYSWRAGDP